MNTHTLPFTRHLWSALIALTACAGFLISAPSVHAAIPAGETPLNTATGWMWGGTGSDDGGYQGTGWFSLSSSNTGVGSTFQYAVSIPTGDGNLEGYAWSEWYGWLSFYESITGSRCGGKGNARRVGNKIVGAAIILASVNAGEYDGCVVFDHGQGDVTIDPATGTISGHAWSSDYGWLVFQNAKIPAVGAPSGTIAGTNCKIPQNQPSCPPTLSWSVQNVTSAWLVDGSSGSSIPLDISSSLSGVYSVIPPLTNLAAKGFKLMGSSASYPNQELASVTVSASCDMVWADGVCKAAVGTGSISVKNATSGVDVTTSPNCTIPIGGTSCTRRVEWTTSGVSNSFFKIDGVINSTSPSGTLSPNPTFDGSGVSKVFTLFDGTTEIKLVPIKGVCENGSTWDLATGSCKENAAPDGSISTSTCTVLVGEKTCTARFDWQMNSAVTYPMVWRSLNGGSSKTLIPSLRTGTFSASLGMNPDGTGQTMTLFLNNGGSGTTTLLDRESITAQCAGGSAPDAAGYCRSTALASNDLNVPPTCTIPTGSSLCLPILASWTLSGVFGTATVQVKDTSTYGVPLKYGSEPAYGTAHGPTTFTNVVTYGTTTFQVVAWVNNVMQEVGPRKDVVGVCATDAHWESGKCVTNTSAPTGDLTVGPNAPAYPSCVNLNDGDTDCEAKIEWNSSNTTNLRIERSVDGGSTWSSLYAGLGASGSYDNQLTAPGTYKYRLVDDSGVLDTGEITMSCQNNWDPVASSCVGDGYGSVELLDAAGHPTAPCKIPLDGNSCHMDARWTVSYVANPSLLLTQEGLVDDAIDNITVGASVGYTQQTITGGVTLKYGANIFEIVDGAGNAVSIDTDGVGGGDSPDKQFMVSCDSGGFNHVTNKCALGGPQ